ncbi:MAG: hypothetical protein ABIN96_05940 [Rubrivivax sp.]
MAQRNKPDPGTSAPQDQPPGKADAADLALPHERDTASGHVAVEPDPAITQAKKDLDAGQVDTDLWGTAGLDHQRREQLVPDAKGEQTKGREERRSVPPTPGPRDKH